MTSQKLSGPNMHNLDDRGLSHDLDRTLQSRSIDSDIYKMMVLRFASDCTEEDVDQHFLRMAIDLGITVPQNPKTTLDLVTSNVSALALGSVADEDTPTSRTSQSTRLTSDSTSEDQPPSNPSSITTVSSCPASINSVSSIRSSYTKFKRSWRRISTLRRSKTVDGPVRTIHFPTPTIKALTNPTLHNPPRSDPFPASPALCKSILCLTEDASRLEPGSPSPDREEADDLVAARQRSIDNVQLQKLHARQLEEQGRFVRFEANQYHLLRLKQVGSKRALLDRYTRQSQALRSQQSDALTSLEHHHLSAEVDLNRTLQLERQGCETRLRHMKAYCNPRSSVDGMPSRSVTRQDRRLLEQQYHVRNGMDNLHAARINVLREKQAKQLERIAARQQSELESLSDELDKDIQDLHAAFEDEKRQLRREFSERKRRLVARWALAEAIERRTLENLTGESYGPLPSIAWTNRSSTVEPGDQDEPDEGFAHDALKTYDATALPIIGVDM